MRAERLLSIAKDISDDLKTTKTIDKLSEIVNALTQVESDNSMENQSIVVDAIASFDKAANLSIIAKYPPALWDEIKHMKIDYLFGEELIQLVKDDLLNQLIAPSVVRIKLTQHLEQLRLLKEEADNAISALEYFEIKPDTLSPGEFEVMVVIPIRSIDGELVQLGREAVKLNSILGVFSEIATGSREPVKLRAIGSSDPTFFLDSLPGTAALVAKAIASVAALYNKTQVVLKTYQSMQEQNIPDPIISQMKSYIDESINLGLLQISAQIEEEHMSDIESGRKAELRHELKSSLTGIARRLDEGYIFDVHGQPNDEKQSENNNNAVDRDVTQNALDIVDQCRPKLMYFQPSPESVFLLSKDEEGSTNSS